MENPSGPNPLLPSTHKQSSSIPPDISKTSTIPHKAIGKKLKKIEYEINNFESIFNENSKAYKKAPKDSFQKTSITKKDKKYYIGSSLTKVNEDNLKVLFKLYRKNYGAS